MENLRQLRREQGLTQQQVATALGIDRTTYTKYENGTTEPNHATLQKMAELFDTTADYLLGFSDQRSRPQAAEQDPEVLEILEYYKNRPGARLLFSVTRNATAEDIIAAAELIERRKRERE